MDTSATLDALLEKLVSAPPGVFRWLELDKDRSIALVRTVLASSTPLERQNPALLCDPSRQERLAKGSGMSVDDVADFVDSFHRLADVVRAIEEKKRGWDNGRG